MLENFPNVADVFPDAKVPKTQKGAEARIKRAFAFLPPDAARAWVVSQRKDGCWVPVIFLREVSWSLPVIDAGCCVMRG